MTLTIEHVPDDRDFLPYHVTCEKLSRSYTVKYPGDVKIDVLMNHFMGLMEVKQEVEHIAPK